MNTPTPAYDKLRTELREIGILSSIGSLLGWDQQVMLPEAGNPYRAGQMEFLAKLIHERSTSGKLGDLIAAAEAEAGGLDRHSDAAVVARDARRGYDRETKLPGELVAEMAKTEVLGHQAWVEARKNSSYASFKPWLAKWLDLKKQEIACVGYKDHPYDALLDRYEPYETAAGVTKVFESLRDELVSLVQKIAGSSKKAPIEIMERSYDVKAQEAFGRLAAEAIGFDFTAGRLDVSVHPFCSGQGQGDTRMTTRYHENHFNDAFFGVLHETGHALYEQGLQKEKYLGEALGDSVSLGIHESQSRMWENLVGRSRAFWKFFMPKARNSFPQTLNGVTDDQWYAATNAVQPSLIRVEADEMTYNLHILIRFEMETALTSGQLGVDDVPAAWNEKYKKYLGITPPNDAKGCLQDVHWSAGLMGYFPTYTLGNLYAAQFYDQATKDIPDLEQQFASGNFKPLLGWLRENIHQHGRRYSARELVKRITGTELSAQPLLNYLRGKASEVYGV
ncbi:MAG TPA: carboxypeptidase M32 [Tepidisphaeraceae bacterium]|nr:carboxypeptidase M32 [Tepidisphaeraceae bacterium]